MANYKQVSCGEIIMEACRDLLIENALVWQQTRACDEPSREELEAAIARAKEVVSVWRDKKAAEGVLDALRIKDDPN